ncbi:MAG: hypothetical protein GY906_22310 [bacterium]|nr:hypothetical protein [bacterium]
MSSYTASTATAPEPVASQGKHTPGPWTVHEVFPYYVVPFDHAWKAIGGAQDPDVEASKYAKLISRQEPTEFEDFYRSRLSPEEASANAALIATAPEMLEALEALFDACCEADAREELSSQIDGSLLDAASEAMAKARGQR